MKKLKLFKNIILFAIIIFCGFVTLKSNVAGADDGKVEMVLFYSPTCPHCHHAMEFLDKEVSSKYKNLAITKYNTSTKVGANYYFHYAKKLGIDNAGAVPLAVFGDKYELGFGSAETTGKKYIEHIEEMLKPSEK